MSNQNIVLTSSQFNELSSFINTTKLSLEKINSLLSNLQPETQTQSIKSTVNTKLVKDPVLYLDEVETKLKKIQSSYWVSKEQQLAYSSIGSYISNIFRLLYEPLQLFENIERIGNPFKHKYSELFNTYVEFIQEKLPNFKETIKVWMNYSEYTYIQNIIYINYTEPIFKNIKDVRWLLSLMLVYPDLFVFTEKHYKDAVNNNVARDNLYLLKKFLKKDIENDKYADNN
jgi:hypothetical protein